MQINLVAELVCMVKQDSRGVLLSVTDQYIIDAVRTIRLNLNISQNVLSKRAGYHISLVSTAESISTTHKYTDPELHKIAHVFTEVSMELKKQLTSIDLLKDLQTDYSLYDFYPKEALSDSLTVKSLNVISDKIFPTGAVSYLLEDTSFLTIPRSTKDVTDEVNKLFNRNWKTTDLGSPLERAAGKGDLFKTESTGVVTYNTAQSKK